MLLSEGGTEGTPNDGVVEGVRDGWRDPRMEGVVLSMKEEEDSDGAPLASIGLIIDEGTRDTGDTEGIIVGYPDRSIEGSRETCPEGANE